MSLLVYGKTGFDHIYSCNNFVYINNNKQHTMFLNMIQLENKKADYILSKAGIAERIFLNIICVDSDFFCKK